MVLKVKDWLKARYVMDRLEFYLSITKIVHEHQKDGIRKQFKDGIRKSLKDKTADIDTMLRNINDAIDMTMKRR